MRFRDLHPNLKIRFYESLLTNVLGNMIHPFMAIYFAERFGMKLAGLMMTATVLVGVFAGFLGGPLADRVGRRRVMLSAECLRFLAFAAMAFANSPWLDSALVTFFMTALISFCMGVSHPAADAMLIDCSTEENRAMVYSLGYWSWNVTVLAGGFLGGFFFRSHLLEILMGAALVSLLAIFLLVFFIKETYLPAPDAAHKSRDRNPFAALLAYREVAKDKLFMLFAAASLCFFAVELMASRYAGVRLAEEMPQTLISIAGFQFPVDGVKMFGILSAENALMVVALGLFVPYVTKRFADKHVLVVSLLSFAVGYGVIAASNQPWLLIAMMVLATAGELLEVPVAQSYLAKIVPEASRSTYMASYQLTHQIAALLGSLAITLGAYLSSWMMGCLFGILGMISIYLYMKVVNRLQQRQRLTEQEAAAAASVSG